MPFNDHHYAEKAVLHYLSSCSWINFLFLLGRGVHVLVCKSFRPTVPARLPDQNIGLCSPPLRLASAEVREVYS